MLTSWIILSVRILYNDVDFYSLSWLLQDISSLIPQFTVKSSSLNVRRELEDEAI